MPKSRSATRSAGGFGHNPKYVPAGGDFPEAYTAISFDDAPVSNTYTGETGSADVDVQNGGPTPYFEHVAGGGWTSGGAAKFYAATEASSTGVYRGLTNIEFPSDTAQLNIRYLTKWNSAWAGALDAYTGSAPAEKGDMFWIGSTRFWAAQNHIGGAVGALPLGCTQVTQSYDGTLFRVHGGSIACDYQGTYEVAGCDAYSTRWGDRPFLLGEWVDEWVCVEFELTTSGRWKIYITTQDRAYDGPYMESTNSGSGAITVTGISGMYFHEQPGAASGAYVMMDELYVAGSYIGPPAGF
jgi:hypothetical protein